jgi:hypothetical protein
VCRVFNYRNFYENLYIVFHSYSLETLRSACTSRYSTRRTMYLHACISSSTGEIFMKIHVWYFTHIRQMRHKFGYDRSFIKGTLLAEKCIFHHSISASIAGISTHFISCTKSLWARNQVSFVPIARYISALYLESNETSRLPLDGLLTFCITFKFATDDVILVQIIQKLKQFSLKALYVLGCISAGIGEIFWKFTSVTWPGVRWRGPQLHTVLRHDGVHCGV